ncbi:phosphoenolpyruvate-utilizing N-terminal domain-containing protein, partial [Ruminococcus sp.]|uniref:phosphoenolpyruvate-utilizing N-terminal domain-containing protein n=1 Tax=Ruminococcus sp. TaxID=41978 RepID=UPI00386C7536
MLNGIGASDGIGVGRVMLIAEQSLDYTPREIADVDAELERFRSAVDKFCDNTMEQAEAIRQSTGEKEAEILLGHIAIIRDPFMGGEIENLIKAHQCAESAVDQICKMFIDMFSATGDDLTMQRAADVRDIRDGVISVLLGVQEVKISDAPEGTVLVVKELTPSMTAGINKENIVGIITETGSQTSHSAILARALEIPAALSVANATTQLSSEELVIVDGFKGNVLIAPDAKTIDEYTAKRDAYLREKRELENFRGKTTAGADGIEYELFCNIGTPKDATKAVEADGEGVGLFRTEFLFMDRDRLPTQDEQF